MNKKANIPIQRLPLCTSSAASVAPPKADAVNDDSRADFWGSLAVFCVVQYM
jgi:hypothetical protein